MNNKSEFKAVLRAMPPLAHSQSTSKEFDIDKSEPVAWLMEQPGFKQWVWNKMLQSRAIKFDPVSRKWQGGGK